MDRMLNSNKDTESIYEIYRACRLCGGGAGYKMPIIQTIVDLDESDVELKQKIRDCVQIEVHQDDKMPPLICELCVDKVNDFYEFLDMCRQTNKRTRLKLGLPPQSLPRGAPDAGDCILGLTEPLFVNDDSDGEPLSKHKKSSKVKIKKEPVVRIKVEKLEEPERTTRQRRREPTPPRVTRNSKSKDDEVSPVSLKDKTKSQKVMPKSILKKENSKTEEDSLPLTRLKRSRDESVSDTKKGETPKKVKITVKSPPQPKLSPKSSPRPIPKSKPSRVLRSPVVVTPPKRPPSPVRETFACDICGYEAKTVQARMSHMRTHIVGFTNSRLACNPCGDWFLTPEEFSSHQKRHKNIPYTCRRCYTDFKKLPQYESHITHNECIPFDEVPDVKCQVCWRLFATNNLLDNHKCYGEDNRPGGKCPKCNRSYTLLKNLKKHESTCTAKKRGEPIIDKELLEKLKPIQIRVARCDPLLVNVKREHYDVSSVSDEYGLDRNCYYPYTSGVRIKSEFQGMVNIHDDIKKEFCPEDYVHWDSEDSESDEEISCNMTLHPTEKKKIVSSLTALTLKTIFSKRLLGKMPRKKRRLKPEKVFDSMLADQDEVRMDIDSLIYNLGNDFDNNDNVKLNDTNVSDENDKVINDSLVENGDSDNSNKNKTDIVSSNDDSPFINSVIYDISKEDGSIKDNTSVDSLDILKDMKNSFDYIDEKNTVNVQNNSSNNNSVDNCVADDISNLENYDNTSQNDDNTSQNYDNTSQNDENTSQNDDNTSQNDDNTSQNNHNTYQNDSSHNSTPVNIDNLDSKDQDSNFNNYNDNNSTPTNIDTDSLDSKDQNSKVNNYNDNYTIDKLLNNIQNNDSLDKSESVIDKFNDKVSLDDLITSNAENKVGLGSIEDFSFDS